MRIRWIWIAVLGLAVAQNGRGQQLPAVIGWKDGGHYIEQVREGKRNVLYAVVDLLKVTAHLGNIAARGEMPAFIDRDIPPIGRIIKVGLYIFRYF